MECVETARKHPERLKPLVGGPILKEDAVLLNVGPKPPVALQDNYDYRWGAGPRGGCQPALRSGGTRQWAGRALSLVQGTILVGKHLLHA